MYLDKIGVAMGENHDQLKLINLGRKANLACVVERVCIIFNNIAVVGINNYENTVL